MEWSVAGIVSEKLAQELLECVVTSALEYGICHSDDIRSQLKECVTGRQLWNLPLTFPLREYMYILEALYFTFTYACVRV